MEKIRDIWTKNREYIKIGFLFLASATLMLFLWDCRQSADPLYMYAHAEDMLKNGFVRHYDIFSMHQGFEFLYQKWASCLLVYWIVRYTGWYGFRIATYVMGVLLFGSLSVFIYIYDRKHMMLDTILCIVCGIMLSDSSMFRFRPHVMAGIIFIWMFVVLEGYTRRRIKADFKFYLFFVAMSILLMWLHSTMWIMYITVFLPYVCDLRKISRILSGRVISFMERQYKLKPLFISMVLMFVSGVFNPNGIDEYPYMYVCLKAVGSKYVRVDELTPAEFKVYGPMLFSVCVIMILLLYVCYKTKVSIYLPSLYLFMGSILMPLVAERLMFYSAVFIVVASVMQLSFIEDVNICLEPYIIPLCFWLMFVSVCFIGGVNYRDRIMRGPRETASYDCGVLDSQIDGAVDWLCDNFGTDITIASTMPHVGSYGIYRGIRPYADCRQEVYDIDINHKKDILSEILDLNNDRFNGLLLEEGGLEAFDACYKPDYYIVTKYTHGDAYLKFALDKAGCPCIYSRYDFDSDKNIVMIYETNF